jgi:hypothetical protein
MIEIHTAEPLVPGPSHEVEIAVSKLKNYKSPDSDQISVELIEARCETLVSVIHELINSIWNKEELPDQCQFTKRTLKLTVRIILGYHCYQLHTTIYRTSSLHV